MACKDTYKSNVLDYNPGQNAEDFEAEYHSAIKTVMIHMLLADGVIEDSEIEVAKDVYHKITGMQIDNEAFLAEISSVEGGEEKLSACLHALQGSLNDEGKELVVKAALYIAWADEEFQEEEQELLVKIASDLGMTKAHFQGVVGNA